MFSDLFISQFYVSLCVPVVYSTTKILWMVQFGVNVGVKRVKTLRGSKRKRGRE